MGFQNLDIASNGLDVLTKLEQNNYDLILMDCEMPEMDGYTASRTIREIEIKKQLGHSTIIAMTAHALKGDREKCLAAGMDEYLPKPIQMESLARVVSTKLAVTMLP